MRKSQLSVRVCAGRCGLKGFRNYWLAETCVCEGVRVQEVKHGHHSETDVFLLSYCHTCDDETDRAQMAAHIEIFCCYRNSVAVQAAGAPFHRLIYTDIHDVTVGLLFMIDSHTGDAKVGHIFALDSHTQRPSRRQKLVPSLRPIHILTTITVTMTLVS